MAKTKKKATVVRRRTTVGRGECGTPRHSGQCAPLLLLLASKSWDRTSLGIDQSASTTQHWGWGVHKLARNVLGIFSEFSGKGREGRRGNACFVLLLMVCSLEAAETLLSIPSLPPSPSRLGMVSKLAAHWPFAPGNAIDRPSPNLALVLSSSLIFSFAWCCCSPHSPTNRPKTWKPSRRNRTEMSTCPTALPETLFPAPPPPSPPEMVPPSSEVVFSPGVVRPPPRGVP